jgi:hypothetical protein
MSDLDPDLRAWIKDTEIEVDRFEKQPVMILVFTLALAVMTCSIPMQVLP